MKERRKAHIHIITMKNEKLHPSYLVARLASLWQEESESDPDLSAIFKKTDIADSFFL